MNACVGRIGNAHHKKTFKHNVQCNSALVLQKINSALVCQGREPVGSGSIPQTSEAAKTFCLDCAWCNQRLPDSEHVNITHVFIDPRDHLHRARRAWQCCPHALALGTSSDETGGLANFGSFHGNTGAM